MSDSACLKHSANLVGLCSSWKFQSSGSRLPLPQTRKPRATEGFVPLWSWEIENLVAKPTLRCGFCKYFSSSPASPQNVSAGACCNWIDLVFVNVGHLLLFYSSKITELEVRSLWAKTPKAVNRQWEAGLLSVLGCEMERLLALSTSRRTAGPSELPGSSRAFSLEPASRAQSKARWAQCQSLQQKVP